MLFKADDAADRSVELLQAPIHSLASAGLFRHAQTNSCCSPEPHIELKQLPAHNGRELNDCP